MDCSKTIDPHLPSPTLTPHAVPQHKGHRPMIHHPPPPLPPLLLRRRGFTLILLLLLLLPTVTYCSSAADDLPPVRTEIKYASNPNPSEDDPDSAWEEWGETATSRKNPFPKRQRKIEPGMDIHTVMGMAMRQPKVVLAVLSEQFGASQQIGQAVTAKFKNQLAAAGIGCRLWFVSEGRQVVANCETIRDGHMAKEYMIRQPEIIRTVLDNVPFTPRPAALDDDEDDDDDDDDDDGYASNKNFGGSKEDTHAPSSSNLQDGTQNDANAGRDEL